MRDKVYKCNFILRWLFKRSKYMTQQNQVRHRKIIAETTAVTTDAVVRKMPSKKRKEDAKQALYLNRI